MNPMLTKKVAVKEHIYNIRERIKNLKKIPVTKTVLVENEHLWKTNSKKYLEEFIRLIDNGPLRQLIKGECAGAGKTYGALEYGKVMKSRGKKVLAVGPTNKRAKELRNVIGENNAMTLHKLLKMRIKNGEAVDGNSMKKNPLDGVDVLIIDEIFAFPVRMLGKIKSKIIDKYPDLKIIATGDPFQSRVNDVKVHDIDGYYESAIATMFSYGILLQINKRMATEEDCRKSNIIKSELKNGCNYKDISYLEHINEEQDIIERHITQEGTFTGQILCYYRDTGKYVSRLIQDVISRHPGNQDKEWKYVEGMMLCEGQELINKEWFKVQGKVLNINDTFVVSRMYDYVEVKTDDDGNEIEYSRVGIEIIDELTGTLYIIKDSQLKNFVYPYCVTIHSSQGDTYSDCPVTLLDFDAFWITKNDQYVAISRANRISNIRLYTGVSLRVSEEKIKTIVHARLLGHKAADKTSGRPFNEDNSLGESLRDEYVDVEWVLETLGKQKMTCAHADCGCDLSLLDSESSSFSIDRKDNRFAHTKENCVIACRKSNVSRKEL